MIVATEGLGQLAFGHKERAEDPIPERECRGEIRIATFVRQGVMPAVKNGRGDNVLEWSERPIEVRVNPSRS